MKRLTKNSLIILSAALGATMLHGDFLSRPPGFGQFRVAKFTSGAPYTIDLQHHSVDLGPGFFTAAVKKGRRIVSEFPKCRGDLNVFAQEEKEWSVTCRKDGELLIMTGNIPNHRLSSWAQWDRDETDTVRFTRSIGDQWKERPEDPSDAKHRGYLFARSACKSSIIYRNNLVMGGPPGWDCGNTKRFYQSDCRPLTGNDGEEYLFCGSRH